MVSSTLGSSTKMGWKRRSSAASFSMVRYSSRVVAPIMRSSPRARGGLSMLPASTAPSALPAPTMVCSSSMNRMISPAERAVSSMTALRRSSNSPRYLAPARRLPMSSWTMRLFCSPSGTSLLMMRCASPSAMAVLPTPGSPMRTGLFLVRRSRIWTARLISSSLPMTGSSLPSRARWVRSMPYFSSDSKVPSALRLSTCWPPRMVTAASLRAAAAGSASSCLPATSRRATRSVSAATKASCHSKARASARVKTLPSSALMNWASEPDTTGSLARPASTAPRAATGSAPARSTTRLGRPAGSASSAAARCSGPTCCC